MAKVTTGTGDAGYTGLLGSERVAKYDPRPDTFGTVDEATSALGLARTIIRRAERMAVKLLHDGVIQNGEVIRYLNRLSDLIFILARYIEVKSSLAQRPE